MSLSLESGLEGVYSEFANDPDFAEILEMFVEGMPERVVRLRESFAQGDLMSVRTLAHQLKGSGAGYGFPEISLKAEILETCCKNGDFPGIAASLEQLSVYLGRVSL